MATFKAIDNNAEPIVKLRHLGQLLIKKLDWAVEHKAIRTNGKMDRLLALLDGQQETQSRAMVFVQQRIICRCVSDYISLLPSWKGKCGMVVGQATGAGVSLHGLPSHHKTINAFRNGEINVSKSTHP